LSYAIIIKYGPQQAVVIVIGPDETEGARKIFDQIERSSFMIAGLEGFTSARPATARIKRIRTANAILIMVLLW